jgi:peptide/nickel transport system substrate-binding protein
MVTTSRRTIVKGIAAGSGSLLMPMPFIRPAQAASARDTLVQAHSEPVTGNWDPTSHTILPQHYMELLVMGQLFRMPLRHEDPSAVVWELARGQKLIDFYTLEYALRDGVKFHDGKPFSAEDVKATFEYASQRNKTAPWYPGVCEVEVVDRLTARVHTKTGGFPASAFFLLGSFLPIMSKADVDDPARLKQRLNGTGPFKFVEQQGDTTVLVANEDHLGGPPILKHIRFPWIADSTTRMLGLLSGEIDITEKMEPEQYASLLNDKRVKLTSTMAAENMNLAFRTNKAPTDNPLVRLAIAHAIDRSEILNLVGPAGKECETFLPAVKFGSEPVANYPKFDPQKCQDLLAQAGFPGGNGMPELQYSTSTGLWSKTKEYSELIVAQLQAQGIPCKLTVMETSAFLTSLFLKPDQEPAAHLIDYGFNTGSAEPNLFLRTMFYSKVSPVGGIFNGCKDPEIDAAIDAETNETDLEKRRALVEAACSKIAEKVPSFSLYTSMLLHGLRANLEGIYIYPNGSLDASKAYFTS